MMCGVERRAAIRYGDYNAGIEHIALFNVRADQNTEASAFDQLHVHGRNVFGCTEVAHIDRAAAMQCRHETTLFDRRQGSEHTATDDVSVVHLVIVRSAATCE